MAGEDKLISSYDVAERLKTLPEEYKILTGWSGLDAILKGFRLKQVVTIAAPTKAGKTSYCIDLTARMKPQHPLWFPFEEGTDELVQKFIDRKEEPPLFYVPARITGNTLLWIEKKIIESIAKYETQVVFIDHLHFIVPFSAERQDLRIGETMRALKGMAKKWNVVIFIRLSAPLSVM
jgi:replicative DNA helicase